jgi:hypothetical protein
MKIPYRKFWLDAHRENCFSRYRMLYYSIYDKYHREWVCGYIYSQEGIINKLKDLKQWVDNFYENIKNKICSSCYEELDENLYCKYCDIDYKKY